MRRLTAINFINQFFWAMIVVTLPLYLIEKDINVEEIGLILSIIPIAMIVLRTLLSMIADIIGTKLFFVIAAVMQMLTSAAYMFAVAPMQFALGKLFEGGSYSFFWAVDRTAIFKTAKNKGVEAAKMTSVRMVGAALGLVLGGLIAREFSFEAVYHLLVFLGAVSFVLAITRHNTEGQKERILETLDLKNKGPLYWKASLAMASALAFISLFFSFLLPVFMDLSLHLDYATIGFYSMFFFAGLGTGSYFATKKGLDEKKLYFLQLLTLPVIVILPYTGIYFPLFLLVAGLGSGVVFGMYEELIAETTVREKNVSTSVALLHIPGRFVEFVLLAASGFIFMYLGSEALFILCAVLLCIFIVLTKQLLAKLGPIKKGAKS